MCKRSVWYVSPSYTYSLKLCTVHILASPMWAYETQYKSNNLKATVSIWYSNHGYHDLLIKLNNDMKLSLHEGIYTVGLYYVT